MPSFSRHLEKLMSLPLSRRQRVLAGGRVPIREAEFVAAISREGGDAGAATILWMKLKEWGFEEGFTPYPTDSLEFVFGIAEEELDEDMVLSTLRELGVSVPCGEEVLSFGVIDSALRIAQFVAFCKTRVSNGPEAG